MNINNPMRKGPFPSKVFYGDSVAPLSYLSKIRDVLGFYKFSTLERFLDQKIPKNKNISAGDTISIREIFLNNMSVDGGQRG